MENRAGAIAYSMVAAIMLVGAGAHIYMLDGIDGEIWSRCFVEDTAYAAGYSDPSFRQVKRGMSASELNRLLGPPLEIHRLADGTESWRYSWSPEDRSYRIRSVLLGDGSVRQIFHEFYVD